LFRGSASPAITPVSESNPDFDSSLTPYTYDLELAKDYLEMAGYKVRKTSFKGITLIMILGLLSLSVLSLKKRKRK